MGDRYFISVICPKCSTVEDDVYYAPTCGFTEWECPGCGVKVDLAEYTGISYEDASNQEEIERLMIDKLKIGDPVEVLDDGLAMLRALMPDQPPNNLGIVAEIWDDGTVLVEFPLSGEEHNQVAPYPRDMVRKLTE